MQPVRAYTDATYKDGIGAHAHRDGRSGAGIVVLAPLLERAVEGIDTDVWQVNHWKDAQAHHVAAVATEGRTVRISLARAYHRRR